MTESARIQYLENHLPFVQFVKGFRRYSISNILRCYEDNPAFRKRFNDDINLVVSALGNPFPFDTTNLTAVNYANISFNDEIVANIRLIPEIGNELFGNVWTD